MTMTDAELVAAAATLNLSTDRKCSPKEQAAAAFCDALAEQLRQRAATETFIALCLRDRVAEQARAEEQARREAEDPLTVLVAPLVPSSDTDLVFLGGLNRHTAEAEFRRADGKRYRYTVRGLEVACVPAADMPDLASEYPASLFDDLLGMFEHAAAQRDAKLRKLLTPRDPHAARPDEHAVGIVTTRNPLMFGVLARWYRTAVVSPREGSGTVAAQIRRVLSEHGRIDLIEDEHAQIMASGNGFGPTYRKDAPSYMGG